MNLSSEKSTSLDSAMTFKSKSNNLCVLKFSAYWTKTLLIDLGTNFVFLGSVTL